MDYETTGGYEPFKGTVVSGKSVAHLIAKTTRPPHLHSNTNADKPYFM